MNSHINNRSLDVVVAGLAVVDVIARTVDLKRLPEPGGLRLIDSITLTTGGNVCNYGIDLVKLGFRVGAITRIGADGLGGFVRSQLESFDIDTSGVTVDASAQTSATVVTVDRGGERSFLHTRGSLRNFTARDVLNHLSLLKRSKIFAFGYYGLLPECEKDFKQLFRTVKERAGVSILVDTGGTPVRNPSLLRAFLPYVDYFIPSYDEAVACTGQATPESIVQYLYRAGARGVVGVKLGARGCYMAERGRGSYVPACRVKHVVDATGAGDAFVSGFLAATLSGCDPFSAARIGNIVAASAVTAVGASTAIRPLETYLRRR